MITLEQLLDIAKPVNKANAVKFLGPINDAMKEFGIDTAMRQAAFLAQLLHESGRLVYVQEIASGKAYEGRESLGNTVAGYGVKYKGRGLIQITGFSNYKALMMALDINCVEHPEVVEEPVNAARSAGWFWKTNNLNKWADIGDLDGVSDVINRGRKTVKVGDSNGWDDRLALYKSACRVLAVKQ
jgi:putative chitinase